MNVKVLNTEGNGPASSIMEGIEYAVDNGADIISMSLGGSIWPPDGTDPLSMTANAAVDAGVVVIVAAGNSGVPFQIGTPAVAEKVIAVGASTKDDEVAEYSSQGPSWDHRIKPEVVAPGGASPIFFDPAGLGIVSTKASGSLLDQMYPDYGVDKYYLALSGTSMATPHVSGVVALLLQAYPQLTPEQIKQRLMNTGVDLGSDPINQGAGRIDSVSAVENTVSIIPVSLSYIMNPGTKTEETIKITNNGKKKRTLSVIDNGDLNVKFSTETVQIEPGETKSIIAMIGIPAGLSAGVHSGNIMLYDGDILTAKIPVLEDTPMTFIGGKSELHDKIEIRSLKDTKRGTNYYYFDVPEGVPGISSTLKFKEHTDMFLVDPDGAFADQTCGYQEKIPATVSTANPKAGRWMILLDSRTNSQSLKEIPITLTTYLNVLKLQPSLWIPTVTISAGNSIIQNFTVTNTAGETKPVHVDAYLNVPNSSASGTFKGNVSNIRGAASMNTHTFNIPDSSTQYTFTLTTLDNKDYISASIYDPRGMLASNIEAGISSGSVKINDPMPGEWSVNVNMGYAPKNSRENYRGDYAVISKNTVWITSKPDTLLIQGFSSKKFSSTLALPADANGYYTGELTVSGDNEYLKVPISVNAGQNIVQPGDFGSKIRNEEWRYYNSNVNSDHLNVSIGWNNTCNDLDLFVFDPSGKSVASSTRSNSVNEEVSIPNPVAGVWIIGVYGYNVTGNPRFTGTLS
jgi:serine protease AprX